MGLFLSLYRDHFPILNGWNLLLLILTSVQRPPPYRDRLPAETASLRRPPPCGDRLPAETASLRRPPPCRDRLPAETASLRRPPPYGDHLPTETTSLQRPLYGPEVHRSYNWLSPPSAETKKGDSYHKRLNRSTTNSCFTARCKYLSIKTTIGCCTQVHCGYLTETVMDDSKVQLKVCVLQQTEKPQREIAVYTVLALYKQ